MISGKITKERMLGWRVVSPEEDGFFEVIAPRKKDCEQSYIYRLNLPSGHDFILNPAKLSKNDAWEYVPLELNAILISGRAKIANDAYAHEMTKLDSFYVTSTVVTQIHAVTDCVFYIGGAIDEGYGKPYFRKLNLDLPIGDIHQIHGEPGSSGQREVYMTCGPEVEASRLEVGITWSGDGTWTSWPPHQHEQELEETYCYFDMEPPHFGLQLSYIEPGAIEDVVAHTVYSGVFCMAPRGYHPTAASPGSRNAYIWIMCAHSHDTRRYDLAVPDPTRRSITRCQVSQVERIRSEIQAE